MINLIEIIIYSLVTIFMVYLSFLNISLRNKNKKANGNFIQATLDKAVLYDKLNELIAQEEVKKLEQSDGFLRFISESRDWAFAYIEETQEQIKKFSETAGREIAYFNTYGQTVETGHSESLRKISAAYDELIKLLPKEDTGKSPDQKEK